MIKVTDLTKTYRRRFSPSVPVLHGLSFYAEDGAVTGLIGRNGCGKTTTFRICAGLIKPDSGTVLVDGMDVSRAGDRVREVIALQPESRGLRGQMTGRMILKQFGWFRGVSGAALDAKINELTELLEMEDLIDRRCSGLSRGQAAKLSLARTLIGDTQNVILDEPTNGLDIAAAESVRDAIRRLRDAGRCILISSHVLEDITSLCDRLALVRDGRLVGFGRPEELTAAAGISDFKTYLLSIFRPERAHAA